MDGIREFVTNYWWAIYLIGLVITALFIRFTNDGKDTGDDTGWKITVPIMWPMFAVLLIVIGIPIGLVGLISGAFRKETLSTLYNTRPDRLAKPREITTTATVTATMVNEQLRRFGDTPMVHKPIKCAYCGRSLDICGCGAGMAE